ncbi:MAG: helix-turn-helix domain-containing protein [Methanomassiliicoccales archaeon]
MLEEEGANLYHVVLYVKPSSSWALDISSRYNVPVVILDCIPHEEGGVEGLIEIDVEGEIKEDVIRSIKKHPDVICIRMAGNSEGPILASVVAKRWLAGRAISKSGCFLRGGRTRDGGYVEWYLLAKDEASLQALVRDLDAEGCEVDIRSKILVKEPFVLTKRQEKVVSTALELGYYDFPRRISAKELARRLNVSPSTLSEILQRSERKLVEFYLMNRL